MLATYGTFGVVSVVLLNPGIGVAEARSRGWLRVKKVSGVPVGTTLAAKVIASLPYALGVLLAMTAVSLVVAGPVVGAGMVMRLAGVLLLGALPFALIGLAIGFVTSSNTAAAVLNALLIPMSVASGLWMPLEILPPFVQHLAPFLPTYHLGHRSCRPTTSVSWHSPS
jgi:ABC-2 type transport system permease protein